MMIRNLMKEEEIEAEDKTLIEIMHIIVRIRILMKQINNNMMAEDINSLKRAKKKIIVKNK